MDRAQAIAKARSIHSEARDHKQRQGFHRDKVREKMGELERFCVENGIDFVLEELGVQKRAPRTRDAPATTLRTQI